MSHESVHDKVSEKREYDGRADVFGDEEGHQVRLRYAALVLRS